MDNIDSELKQVHRRLSEIAAEQQSLQSRMNMLLKERRGVYLPVAPAETVSSSIYSHQEKIAIFRRLFRGRQDVYPRRFESRKTGHSGY